MITERVGTEVGIMTGRIKQRFRNGRENVSDFGSSVSNKTRRAASRTDYYVHDNAWKIIGVAVGVAFVAGYFFSTRNQEGIASELNSSDERLQKKAQKMNSWEFVHSALPLTLFLWKAFQASRCARKRT